MPIWTRLPLMALGAVSLLAGLIAGVERAGAGLFPVGGELVLAHGPLMVCGFLGTVIGLERAVAARSAWTYLCPLATGLGALFLVLGANETGGIAAIALGSLLLLIVASHAALRQRELFASVMALGAMSWFVGNLFWLAGMAMTQVVLFWIAFLVLTIGGDRIELSRMMAPSPVRRLSAPVPLALIVAALGLSAADSEWSDRMFGLGLIAFTLWLLSFDIARRTVRQPGVTQFIAVCLLSGYAWLGLAGILLVAAGLPESGPLYDAALHAVFLGFVFAIIFGHVAVILPAVLRVAVPFSRLFYAHLALLNLSLAVRIAGDFAGDTDLGLWGVHGNVAAIILFLVVSVATVVCGKRMAGNGRLD